MIDYKKYIESLNIQFISLINNDEQFKSLKNHFILCDEQFINKNAKNISPKDVFGIISFGTSTFEYGQTQLTIGIEFIGQLNDIQTLQTLLNTFVEKYNLTYLYDTSVLQTFSTPVLNSNFNQIDAGLRGIFTLSGVLLILTNLVDIDKLEYKISDGEYEDIPYLKIVSNITNNPLPEAFSGTYGRTTSTLQFQTQTLSLILTPLNTTFLSTILKDQIEAQGDFTKKYTLKLTYNNDIVSEFEYVLTNIHHERSKASVPSLSLTFTR